MGEEKLRALIEDAMAEVAGIPKEEHINLLGDKNKYIDAIMAKLTEITLEDINRVYNEGSYGQEKP